MASPSSPGSNRSSGGGTPPPSPSLLPLEPHPSLSSFVDVRKSLYLYVYIFCRGSFHCSASHSLASRDLRVWSSSPIRVFVCPTPAFLRDFSCILYSLAFLNYFCRATSFCTTCEQLLRILAYRHNVFTRRLSMRLSGFSKDDGAREAQLFATHLHFQFCLDEDLPMSKLLQSLRPIAPQIEEKPFADAVTALYLKHRQRGDRLVVGIIKDFLRIEAREQSPSTLHQHLSTIL